MCSPIPNQKKTLFQCMCSCTFLKMDDSGEVIDKITFAANTKNTEINFSHNQSDLENIYEDKIKEIDERLQDFSENGSGWVLSDILFLDLTFTTIRGLRGGCSIKYPESRGLLNIDSNDQLCLLYCIAAFFHSDSITSGARRKSSSYHKYLENFNLNQIVFLFIQMISKSWKNKTSI